MPLFKSHSPPPAEPPTREFIVTFIVFVSWPQLPGSDTQSRRHGFFGRRNSSDDSSLGRASSTRTAQTSNSTSTSRSGGLMSHFRGQGFPHNDPTIMAAREKVSSAEEAEKAADRALQAARQQVKEAREHVRFLEKEAEDEWVLFRCLLLWTRITDYFSTALAVPRWSKLRPRLLVKLPVLSVVMAERPTDYLYPHSMDSCCMLPYLFYSTLLYCYLYSLVLMWCIVSMILHVMHWRGELNVTLTLNSLNVLWPSKTRNSFILNTKTRQKG